LADILEQEDHAKSFGIGFDITTYFGTGDRAHECGTVACIAGHAYLMKLKEEGVHSKMLKVQAAADECFIPEKAQKYLGLTDEQGFDLFLGFIHKYHLAGITPKKAATVIRRFVETGKVEWMYRRLDSAILDTKSRRQAAGLPLVV
jgi:hypothetical protein